MKKVIIVSIFLTLIGKLLGFVREQIIAANFGATNVTDGFYLGLIIPTIISGMLGVAISYSFVPEYSNELYRGNKSLASIKATSIIIVSLLLTFVISIIVYLSAEYIVNILLKSKNRELYELAEYSTKILSFSIIFVTLGGLIKIILNLNDEYIASNLAPVVQHLFFIFSFVLPLLVDFYYLVWVTLIGFVLFLLVQLIKLLKLNLLGRITFKEIISSIKIWWFAVPIMIGSLANQFYILIERYLASGFSDGLISMLQYADKVRQLPITLFFATLTTFLTSRLTKAIVKNDIDGFINYIAIGIRIILIIGLPMVYILHIYNEKLISILFNRGEFTFENSIQTAELLAYYSPTVISLTLIQFLVVGFYAKGERWLPVFIIILGSLLNYILSNWLTKIVYEKGIPMGHSIATSITAILFIIFIHIRNNYKLLSKKFIVQIIKVIFSSLLVIIILITFKRLIYSSESIIETLGVISFIYILANLIFYYVLSLLNIPELIYILNYKLLEKARDKQ
jgi:putative peptidoglycan lipid II flippase